MVAVEKTDKIINATDKLIDEFMEQYYLPAFSSRPLAVPHGEYRAALVKLVEDCIKTRESAS